MNDVGLAKIVKKKIAVIDGKPFKYYEMNDVVVGFQANFTNSGDFFCCVSGRNQGNQLSRNLYDDNDYYAIGFKTFAELSTINNNTYNFDKFYNDYKSEIGNLYVANYERNTFLKISDQDLINKLKSQQKKDYDDSILKRTSNIATMYGNIKKTIISQDEQIMQILTSLFKNQTIVNNPNIPLEIANKLKETIMIYGPTGTGKTEIIKQIAKYHNVPLVIEAAPDFSETGYVGREISSMFRDLYLAADKNMEIAEKSILVIDEFDKLAEKGNSEHVSRIGVQRSLLKIFEGHTFYFDDKKFDTSKLSIVCLGAFTGITKDDNYKNVTMQDFISFGIMRELMGRISKYIAMNPLTKEDIKKILLNSNYSPLKTYKFLFDAMNIKYEYEDSFVEYIAEKAIALKSGARSLNTVVDNEIGSALFRLFADEFTGIILSEPNEEGNVYRLLK